LRVVIKGRTFDLILGCNDVTGCVLQHGLWHGPESCVLPSGWIWHVRAHGSAGYCSWCSVLIDTEPRHSVQYYIVINSVVLLLIMLNI